MTSGDAKMTAIERITLAQVTALADGEAFTAAIAARVMEAHAAAAVSELKARVAELERERDEARAERDFQQERAQVNVDLREKAAARVAELEAILDDAPTIDAVESHVPGWLARVRAALGKEAQP